MTVCLSMLVGGRAETEVMALADWAAASTML